MHALHFPGHQLCTCWGSQVFGVGTCGAREMAKWAPEENVSGYVAIQAMAVGFCGFLKQSTHDMRKAVLNGPLEPLEFRFQLVTLQFSGCSRMMFWEPTHKKRAHPRAWRHVYISMRARMPLETSGAKLTFLRSQICRFCLWTLVHHCNYLRHFGCNSQLSRAAAVGFQGAGEPGSTAGGGVWAWGFFE